MEMSAVVHPLAPEPPRNEPMNRLLHLLPPLRCFIRLPVSVAEAQEHLSKMPASASALAEHGYEKGHKTPSLMKKHMEEWKTPCPKPLPKSANMPSPAPSLQQKPNKLHLQKKRQSFHNMPMMWMEIEVCRHTDIFVCRERRTEAAIRVSDQSPKGFISRCP